MRANTATNQQAFVVGWDEAHRATGNQDGNRDLAEPVPLCLPTPESA
jgi:hypothetical protein